MQYTLKHPVNFSGKLYKHLNLPDYLSVGKSCDINAMTKTGEDPEKVGYKIIAFLTNTKVDFIKEISLHDFNKLDEYIKTLFSASEKKRPDNFSNRKQRKNRAVKNSKKNP